MGISDLVTPITLSDGDHVQLGVSDSTLDGTLNFLGNLPAETDVSIAVTDNDETFKSSSLTSTGLLLDGGNLQDFFHKLVFSTHFSTLEEVIDDFWFLDGDSKSEDFVQRGNLTELDKSTQLGGGLPVVLVISSVISASLLTTEASLFSSLSHFYVFFVCL